MWWKILLIVYLSLIVVYFIQMTIDRRRRVQLYWDVVGLEFEGLLNLLPPDHYGHKFCGFEISGYKDLQVALFIQLPPPGSGKVSISSGYPLNVGLVFDDSGQLKEILEDGIKLAQTISSGVQETPPNLS